MEVFRRHCNTSRQVSLCQHARILSTFVNKLRRSGFSRGTVDRIVSEGSKFYYRCLRTDLEGGPPLKSELRTTL